MKNQVKKMTLSKTLAGIGKRKMKYKSASKNLCSGIKFNNKQRRLEWILILHLIPMIQRLNE
jgi:hypothetical protein